MHPTQHIGLKGQILAWLEEEELEELEGGGGGAVIGAPFTRGRRLLSRSKVPRQTRTRGGTPFSRRGVVGRLTTPRYFYEPATSRPTRAHVTPAGRVDGTWDPARCAALRASNGTMDGALGWATHN